MRQKVIAVCACAGALTLSACDYVNGGNMAPSETSSSDLVPPGNSRSVSAPSAISPAVLRHKTCEGLLSRFDGIRRDSGQPGVDRAVDDAINGFHTTPDWAVLTDDQRQATIDGAHDAGTGNCP
ncbi:hypothetical protein [Nocardia sp. NBC_01327]|uniref:hypothetical protein n=1 Tax=Nocardia sp. NBC_01327 TaxID=2903593 RepID=UPI002E0FCBE7|nr:hypothetical protein OG326_21905 [Nocardia sp. NBC_01327]